MRSILALGLACLLFIPANAAALQTHYRSEKENWRNIAGFMRQNLQSDEAIYVSGRFWAHPLLFYEPSFEPRLAGGSNRDLSQLERAAKQHPGLWYLRHVAPIGDPAGELTNWVTKQQFDMLIDGYRCGTGISVYYRRFDDLAVARRAELIRQAGLFCPTDPRLQAQ